MDRFIAKAKSNMSVVPKKVALDLFRKVILRTPVNTGRARGNWQCTVTTPAVGETERTDMTGRQVIAEVASAVDSWDVANVGIFLMNNVAYIGVLEDGSSEQAPNGMVKVSLREYPGIVEREAREAV